MTDHTEKRPNRRESRCIYCGVTKTGPFASREHVLPNGFSRGFKDNPTLRYEVCPQCNKLFGRDLDEPLLIDSAEGLQRFAVGKRANEYRTLGKRQTRRSILRSGDAFDGAPTRVAVRDGRVTNEMEDMVGFRKAGSDGRYRWWKLGELPTSKELVDELGLTGSDGAELHVVDHARNQAAVAAEMAKKGYPVAALTPTAETPASTRQRIEFVTRYDKPKLRGLSKIAFNYLAQVRGGAECYRSEYAAIREWIRSGQGRVTDLVRMAEQPEPFDGQPMVSVVCVMMGQRGTRGFVQLMNGALVYVRLSTPARDAFFSGHRWDYDSRKIVGIPTPLGWMRY